jgi:hypothetical protein
MASTAFHQDDPDHALSPALSSEPTCVRLPDGIMATFKVSVSSVVVVRAEAPSKPTSYTLPVIWQSRSRS